MEAGWLSELINATGSARLGEGNPEERINAFVCIASCNMIPIFNFLEPNESNLV